MDRELIHRRIQMYLHLSCTLNNTDDKLLFAQEAERLSRELMK